jgi:hypothetical protein
MVGLVCFATAIYGIKRHFGIEVVITEVEENDSDSNWQKQGPESEEDEEDEEYDLENVLLFLPTGLSRPVTPKWKPTDPEIQNVKAVAGDLKRRKAIEGELCRLMYKVVPQWQTKTIGQRRDPSEATSSLLYLPYAAPYEFEQPGIALTDNLEWKVSTRSVEPSHHHMMAKIFPPTAAATALYQDIKIKARKWWNGLGKEMKVTEKSDQKLIQHQGSSPATPVESPPLKLSDTTQAPDQSQPRPRLRPSEASEAERGRAVLSSLLPDIQKEDIPTLDLARLHAHLRVSRGKHIPPLPRGCLLVAGLVIVKGDKGASVFNVAAIYDPGTSRFVWIRFRKPNVTPNEGVPLGFY